MSAAGANGTTLWRDTVFAPLDDAGRVESVTQRIASAVQLGLMADGERLPSENDLAAQLNVSTVTLREALVGLRAMGIVETRRGRGGGSFVRRLSQASNEVLLGRLSALSASQWRDVFDERMAVDAASAEFAAERASTTDVEELRVLAEGIRLADSPSARYRADSRFHIAVAVVSQSHRLTQSAVRVQSDISEMLWIPLSGYQLETDKAADQHLALVAAIEAEDPMTSYRLARNHAKADALHLRRVYLQLKSEDPVVQQFVKGIEAE